MSTKIICVILAGGKGSRLDNKGKYLAILNELPLWQHVYDKVKYQFDKTVINVKRKEKKTLSKIKNVENIYDKFEEDIGPLAGIHSAISYAEKNHYSIVCTVPVDTPFLPSDLAQNLFSKMIKTESEVVAAMSKNRIHPTIALWQVNLKQKLEKNIKNKVRKIDNFTKDLKVTYANWKVRGIDPFFNINSYEDLKLAKNMLKKHI